MSERKVLNKYYPPDFDPSKIPRSKEPRNKTFIIRLMAPCNMRCTTCGEYIYKGRKFNARKEDVDDMNHLGLRIYRFYIKCTACLSEISFRTDPANTDYVLEAGATRNFEALAKAEKLEEEKQKAYEEELKNNPMKLLEERTEASKNEMSRVEALEELQELNKRTIKIDYETMLDKYDKLREAEAKAQEKEDNEFVEQLFGKNGGASVKRIVEEDDSDDEDRRLTKKIKADKATDILGGPSKANEKKESWEKSIGSLSATSKKSALGLGIVKKKSKITPAKPGIVGTEPSTSSHTLSSKTSISTSTEAMTNSSTATSSTKSEKPTGLSLLGDYSDSDESD